jgi:ATPase subunit of ABC transporter with duplicated ATPase domains
VNEYDTTQRRIENLRADIIRFRRLKERARDPGTIKRFKSQEERAEHELEQLALIEKPSFWIDRDNVQDLNPKMTTAYQKYKARNIRLDTRGEETKSSQLLVQAHELSLGYGDTPLFAPVDFSLRKGERIRLHGRNGAGKTTLVNAIMAKVNDTTSPAHITSGTLAVAKEITLGLYEQEIDARFLPMTLGSAIERSLDEKGLPISPQKVKQLLGDYLFNPQSDGDTPIERLSGGQKARFQLIRMLLNSPSLLILDEPTNHLDLPSIEELENALAHYNGAVIYISHDSFFADKMGGQTITLTSE